MTTTTERTICETCDDRISSDMTTTQTATYRIYASHLGPGIDADDYAARLRPALSDLYPRVEWRIEVARNVSGVGDGLQGDDPSIDRDAVEHVADRVACETCDDRISIDNGITERLVSDLSDADLARIYPAAVALMDDDLREEVHAAIAPCSDRAFLAAYCTRHYLRFGETLTVP